MDYIYQYRTVVETPEFIKQTRKYLLEIERDALICFLAVAPETGSILRGSGGIRKMRWAYDGHGRRGGLRVIYFYHSDRLPVFAITAFVKGQKATLSDNELQKLATLCRRLTARYGV